MLFHEIFCKTKYEMEKETRIRVADPAHFRLDPDQNLIFCAVFLQKGSESTNILMQNLTLQGETGLHYVSLLSPSTPQEKVNIYILVHILFILVYFRVYILVYILVYIRIYYLNSNLHKFYSFQSTFQSTFPSTFQSKFQSTFQSTF